MSFPKSLGHPKLNSPDIVEVPKEEDGTVLGSTVTLLNEKSLVIDVIGVSVAELSDYFSCPD